MEQKTMVLDPHFGSTTFGLRRASKIVRPSGTLKLNLLMPEKKATENTSRLL